MRQYNNISAFISSYIWIWHIRYISSKHICHGKPLQSFIFFGGKCYSGLFLLFCLFCGLTPFTPPVWIIWLLPSCVSTSMKFIGSQLWTTSLLPFCGEGSQRQTARLFSGNRVRQGAVPPPLSAHPVLRCDDHTVHTLHNLTLTGGWGWRDHTVINQLEQTSQCFALVLNPQNGCEWWLVFSLKDSQWRLLTEWRRCNKQTRWYLRRSVSLAKKEVSGRIVQIETRSVNQDSCSRCCC